MCNAFPTELLSKLIATHNYIRYCMEWPFSNIANIVRPFALFIPALILPIIGDARSPD